MNNMIIDVKKGCIIKSHSKSDEIEILRREAKYVTVKGRLHT